MALNAHYEILLEGSTGKVYNDINYCAFFRCPMVKTASLIKMRLSMDQIDIHNIKGLISDHNFPKLKLKIYYCSEKDNSQTQLVYQQTLQCLAISSPPLTMFKSTNQQLNVDLDLVNPIIYILSKENKFNSIKSNVKAYDVLQSFEQEYLQSRGSGTFSYHHIGDDDNKNENIYEHILVSCPSDLDVPDYLIQTYKVNNTLSFYFFDNFYIGDKTQSDVTCHYINLDSKDKFVKEDIRKFGDKGPLTKPLSTTPICDINDSLNKDNPAITNTHKEVAYINKKESTGQYDKQSKGDIGNISSGVQGRNFKSIKNTQGLEQEQDGKQTTSVHLVTPDKSDSAKDRLELSKKLMNEKLGQLAVYEFTNTHPDFPQFGKIYNLGGEDFTNYAFTPLNIVNIFVRKASFREPYCQLNTRALMIKYK